MLETTDVSLLKSLYYFVVVQIYPVVAVLVNNNFNQKTFPQQPGYDKISKIMLLVI